MGYTEKRNLNRGYMKLDVWNEAMALFQWVFKTTQNIHGIDFKLRSQIINAAQSISANIAEGYCRRSINEYLQFLNIALGSSGELMTRMIGLLNIDAIQKPMYDSFDTLHFSVENKLVALTRSLQLKRKTGAWAEEFSSHISTIPLLHYSIILRRRRMRLWRALFHYSSTPSFHYSIIPLFHHSIIPLFHYSITP